MPNDHTPDAAAALFKLALAWLGAVLGSITLQHLVLVATLIYTVVQTALLIRDKVVRDKANRAACPPRGE